MTRWYPVPNGWSIGRWQERPAQLLVLRLRGRQVGNIYRASEREQWEANVCATQHRERVTRSFWRRCEAKRWVELEASRR